MNANTKMLQLFLTIIRGRIAKLDEQEIERKIDQFNSIEEELRDRSLALKFSDRDYFDYNSQDLLEDYTALILSDIELKPEDLLRVNINMVDYQLFSYLLGKNPTSLEHIYAHIDGDSWLVKQAIIHFAAAIGDIHFLRAIRAKDNHDLFNTLPGRFVFAYEFMLEEHDGEVEQDKIRTYKLNINFLEFLATDLEVFSSINVLNSELFSMAFSIGHEALLKFILAKNSKDNVQEMILGFDGIQIDSCASSIRSIVDNIAPNTLAQLIEQNDFHLLESVIVNGHLDMLKTLANKNKVSPAAWSKILVGRLTDGLAEAASRGHFDVINYLGTLCHKVTELDGDPYYFNRTMKYLNELELPTDELVLQRNKLIDCVKELQGGESNLILTAIMEKTEEYLCGKLEDNKYQEFAKKVQGHASVGMKILGGIMMAIGGLAVAAGITISVVSVGLGVPVGVGLTVSGSAFIAAGVTFFAQGRPSGLSKAMIDLYDEKNAYHANDTFT